MQGWDIETDIVIVGSGAAGLSAALTARELGLEVVILEKEHLIGGSTALAGGGMWIPNNHLMRNEGVHDSTEEALTYLDTAVGDQGPATSMARKRAFVETAAPAIKFYEKAGLRFRRTPNYPDYYPDLPGASVTGRGIESVIFDMRHVDQFSDRLIKRAFPRSMPVGTLDMAKFVLARRTMAGLLVFIRVVAHHIWGKVTLRKLAGGGAALVGQFIYQLMQRGVTPWTNCEVTELVEENGRIVGVVAMRDGKPVRIQARRAVHLGGGGFARNKEMRMKYQPAPIDGSWTSASPSDTGNAIQLGHTAGAALSLMDEAWWGPVSILSNGLPMFLTFERPKPGSLIVDQQGVRFMNEAQSYTDAVHEMFKRQDQMGGGVPAWLVFDQSYRDSYQFGMMLPGHTPKEAIESGYFRRADTIEELAAICKMNPTKLRASIERFNTLAKSGVDTDFGRGSNPYDTYFGDPRTKPNACLGPLLKAPFYAVGMYPGDLGTKGGLVTDEHCRVLREDGSIIEGLYATGNTAATVMGRKYPGPGVTLGPALTYSYRAVHHAAGKPL
jgi:3-oxosteroid 1-dehydrogenase